MWDRDPRVPPCGGLADADGQALLTRNISMKATVIARGGSSIVDSPVSMDTGSITEPLTNLRALNRSKLVRALCGDLWKADLSGRVLFVDTTERLYYLDEVAHFEAGGGARGADEIGHWFANRHRQPARSPAGRTGRRAARRPHRGRGQPRRQPVVAAVHHRPPHAHAGRRLVRPIGLPQTRIDYLRSLADLLVLWDKQTIDPSSPFGNVDHLVADFAEQVRGASFKVAQCALLNARGYHSGIIPVDSGMVAKLAPALGIDLPAGPVAHEKFRHVLEAAVHARPDDFRELAVRHEYAVAIPDNVEPTWWAHLVLIYFKRLYLNGPSPRLCTRRPFCTQVVDCPHRKRGT